MPFEDFNDHLSFHRHDRKIRNPFIVYLDFETRLDETHQTDKIKQIHIPYSYMLMFIYEGQKEPVKYMRLSHDHNQLMIQFWKDMDDIRARSLVIVDNPATMIFDSKAEMEFNNSECCHFCGLGFTKKFKSGKMKGKIVPKVRDHCHVTGKFRGAAHSTCNLQSKLSFKTQIPVVCHNLSGYDSHIIIKSFNFNGQECVDIKDEDGKMVRKKKSITCIPLNGEKFMSFTVGHTFKFIDSARFYPESLSALVEAQSNGFTNYDSFKYTNEFIRTFVTPDRPFKELQKLLIGKGVYPYKKTGQDLSCLPPIEDFFNDLVDQPCSKKDYQRAQEVYKSFGCQCFRDYHDLYLGWEVLGVRWSWVCDEFSNDVSLQAHFSSNKFPSLKLIIFWKCRPSWDLGWQTER